MRLRISILLLSFIPALPAAAPAGQDAAPNEWSHYGGDAGGQRYSALVQIDRGNVSRLEPAWTYRSGDFSDGSGGRRKSSFEATPILFQGTLYFSTPFNRIIALDPATGKERWAFDPEVDLRVGYSEGLTSRGVSAWADPDRPPGALCKARIFVGTIDARLFAVDAARGVPCPDFGVGGEVDLKVGVGKVEKGEYEVTSPPAIVNGLVVVGSAMGDNRRVEVERGVVRAFDARTGRLRWAWDPIPRRPSDPGWETWTPQGARLTGAANAWSVISADPARDLVFVPTGSAAPDFYGGERPGDNLFANCVVALRASTGEVVWHFQVVHHDVWDYDVAAQPTLTVVKRQGREVPAVVINTKMGHVFVLHRETGKPLFPIEERPVPSSDVAGEKVSATQPFPVLPPPLHGEGVKADNLFGLDDDDLQQCRTLFKSLRSEGIFTPPSLKGTVVFPGFAGGVNWSSAAVDPERGIMIVNVNRIPFWVRLVPRKDFRGQAREARRSRMDVQFTSQSGTPYGMSRAPFFSSKRLPCTSPPWGKTVAVDLNDGRILWDIPAGAMPELAMFPRYRDWGSPVFGGSALTRSGLVFVSGTKDNRLRALDIESGRQLWSAQLPAGGQATPMTYQAEGKQFVVIAAGGHAGLGTKLGDYLVAFALEE